MENSNKNTDIQNEELPLSQLRHFSNHPFKLNEGNYFDELVESIKSIGIIQAIIVRPVLNEENVFEILSGHNRFEAAKKAGLSKIPARIYNGLSEDEAMEIVIDTNFYQRSFADLLHSEKAKAITMKHNAIKRQGKRTDLTNAVDDVLKTYEKAGENKGNKTSAGKPQKLYARDRIANEFGLDRDTIACYLHINELVPNLLARLDNGEFGINAAYEVSFLSKLAQEDLHKVLNNSDYKLTIEKAKMIRKAAGDKKGLPFTCADIEAIFKAKEKNNKTSVQIKVSSEIKLKYFPDCKNDDEIEKKTIEALEFYRQHKKAES